MSWKEVEPAGRAMAKRRVTLAVRANKLCGGHFMVVSVGHELMSMLGWPHNHRVAFLWGADNNFGWLRLETRENGFKLRHTGKSHGSAGVIQTSRFHPSAHIAPHRTADCPWQIKGGGLEIKMPDWYWNPRRPGRPVLSSARFSQMNNGDNRHLTLRPNGNAGV